MLGGGRGGARRSAWLVVTVVLLAGGVLEASAQAPRASVPAPLCDRWAATFGELGPVLVQLTPDAAVVYSERHEPLGFLAGRFSETEPMRLRVLWDLPAFQQGAEEPLPATVWPGALLDQGDPAYPGFVATTVELRYDASKDELVGTYLWLEILYGDAPPAGGGAGAPTAKYRSTTATPTPIRFGRATRAGLVADEEAEGGKRERGL